MAKRASFFGILTLLLLLSLCGSIFSSNPAVATTDYVRWCKVNIPTEGKSGNWVLASGSSVRHPTMAIDGTLYCYATPSGTSYTLFKSTDGGRGWAYTGIVTDTIVDIATSPDDANVVCYATVANVYQSTDAGESFTQLPANPGGAGSNNIEITSIDAARLEGKSVIAVGTSDSDGSEYGGVYVPNEPFTDWVNTNIGNYDVLRVALCPDFSAKREIVAAATDETDTVITIKVADNDWGNTVGDGTIAGVVPVAADIAFPDDHDTNGVFLAIDTGGGNGDVYRVNRVTAPGSSAATDLNIGNAYGVGNIDVTSLAVAGNIATGRLLAGAASSAQVYTSTDGGNNWTRSSKEPTGQSRTYALMAPDFSNEGRAYAATSGSESAFSCTSDGGVTWNQIGLINTEMSEIIDLAVSPRYRADNTLFMLTFGSEHSVWRSLNGGTTWERVLNGTLPDIDSIKLIELSPQYGSGSQAVFLAGVSSGNPAVWASTDKGQTFTPRITPHPIDAWGVASDSILFVGGYDGSNGLVYRTDDGCSSYTTGTTAGSQPLNCIVLSPNYEQDKTVLTGNTTGQVYWSDDNSASFASLGQQLPLSAGLGNVNITFDPGFSSNQTVYAASDAQVTAGSEERVFRFIIGRDDTWQSIDSTLPDDATIKQLRVSPDGTLYATNPQSVNTAEEKGGMERLLNPRFPLTPTCETVTRGLDDEVTLAGLWLCNNQLWAIDTKNTRLMTFTDSLCRPIILASPQNQTGGIDTRNVNLEWAAVPGATEYKWQLDHETDFSSVPAGFEGNTAGSSTWLPELEVATKYYWRVRATKPVLSPWSAKWSFTTVLGGTTTAPELLSPQAGADDVARKPVFQWDAVAGADSYEILVSTDVSFAIPVIQRVGSNALPATAWQSDTYLDYNTTYYWKVRGKSSNSYSAWSTVGAFTIESISAHNPSTAPETPAPTVAEPEIPTIEIPPIEIPPLEIPAIEIPPLEIPAPQFTVPDWALYLGIALLATIVLLLVTLLVLVIKIGRP